MPTRNSSSSSLGAATIHSPNRTSPDRQISHEFLNSPLLDASSSAELPLNNTAFPIPVPSPQPSDETEVPSKRRRSREYHSFSDFEEDGSPPNGPLSASASSSRAPHVNGHVRTVSLEFGNNVVRAQKRRQPEEGWDESTPGVGVVMSYEDPQSEVERRMSLFSRHLDSPS